MIFMIRSKKILFLILVFRVIFLHAQDTTSLQLLPVEIIVERSYTPAKISLSRSHFLSAPASFDDPSRLLMKYPGFSVSNDQNNAIIYDGLPSHFSSWSLYGARIANPNHLSNAGTANDRSSRTAGGVNMFSGQVIGGLDYHTGFDGPAKGIGGVADISLRLPYQNSVTANLSLIGLEAGIDRIFDDGNSSLMVNYRYSTVGLLGQLGVDLGDEIIIYQDAIAEYKRKWKKQEFRFTAAYGKSSNDHEASALQGDVDIEFKDIKDINYDSENMLTALHYQYNGWKSTVAYSRIIGDRNEHFVFDSDAIENRSTYEESLLSTYVNKEWKRNKYTIDLHWNSSLVSSENIALSSLDYQGSFYNQGIYFDEKYWLLQPQLSVDTDITDHAMFSMGMQYWKETFRNNNYYLPHASIGLDIFGVQVSLKAGKQAQMQAPELLGMGKFDFNNYRLAPIKSKYLTFHVSKGGFGANLSHRRLNNLTSNNSGLDDLNKVNVAFLRSKDRAEINSLSLYANHRIGKINVHTNLSMMNSKLEDYEDSSVPFDYGYLWNLRVDRLFTISDNKSIRVSSSFHLRKGYIENAIDETQSENRLQTVYSINSNTYGNRLGDYQRVDLRISFVKKGKWKNVISLDIQNVLNRQNDAYNYFDPLTKEVKLQKQLGLIPILSWRVII